MQQDLFWLVAAVSMVVIAVSAAVIAWALVRLAAEAGRTADETNGLVKVLREEVPPTLAAIERAAASLDQLAGEGAGTLTTFDTLATEAEATHDRGPGTLRLGQRNRARPRRHGHGGETVGAHGRRWHRVRRRPTAPGHHR